MFDDSKYTGYAGHREKQVSDLYDLYVPHPLYKQINALV